MNQPVSATAGQRAFEALFLLGLGVLWGLGFWWPGLLIDFGAAYGIALLLRGRYWPAGAVTVLFALVPALYALSAPLSQTIPIVVIGLGAAGVYRALRSA